MQKKRAAAIAAAARGITMAEPDVYLENCPPSPGCSIWKI